MAFSSQHLRIVAHTGNFTLWHYRTDDDTETVLQSDYFADAYGTIKKGDVLIIEKDDGQGGIDVSLYAVTDEAPQTDPSSCDSCGDFSGTSKQQGDTEVR